jgi:phosphinothricin acetyltransferase
MIRPATSNDAKAIAVIYNYYILNTQITFEESRVDEQAISIRILAEPKLPWLVFEESNQVIGYCYATPWKSRSAYRYTLECSVYVMDSHQNKGIGKKLYLALIQNLKNKGFHSVLAGISLPNKVSVSFHEKLGFKKVGQLEQVGFKFKEWIDVGYWQYVLNK